MKSEDMFELVLLVTMLLSFLVIGLGAITREVKSSSPSNITYAEDKNLKLGKMTQDVFGENVDEYTLSEVELAFQIQNFYMPQPKKLSVAAWSTGVTSYPGKEDETKWIYMEPVEVTTLFAADRDIYGVWLQKFVEKNLAGVAKEDLRFKLEYDSGESIKETKDDFFVFRRVK